MLRNILSCYDFFHQKFAVCGKIATFSLSTFLTQDTAGMDYLCFIRLVASSILLDCRGIVYVQLC